MLALVGEDGGEKGNAVPGPTQRFSSFLICTVHGFWSDVGGELPLLYQGFIEYPASSEMGPLIFIMSARAWMACINAISL